MCNRTHFNGLSQTRGVPRRVLGGVEILPWLLRSPLFGLVYGDIGHKAAPGSTAAPGEAPVTQRAVWQRRRTFAETKPARTVPAPPNPQPAAAAAFGGQGPATHPWETARASGNTRKSLIFSFFPSTESPRRSRFSAQLALTFQGLETFRRNPEGYYFSCILPRKSFLPLFLMESFGPRGTGMHFQNAWTYFIW